MRNIDFKKVENQFVQFAKEKYKFRSIKGAKINVAILMKIK
ncbi:hypothetical protein [Anaerosinus sp.]